MRRILLPAVVLSTVLLGCGGGGGSDGPPGGPPPPTPTYLCSDSAPAVNQVVLQCGVKLAPDVWQIDAVIGPPTTSADIDGFAFDILFDPAFLVYVPGSARAGTLFFSRQISSPPLVSVQTAPGDPGRLVVGIASTDTGGGFQGTTSYYRIISLSMKAVAGATFDPQLLHFDNAEALDSTVPVGKPISSITFSDQLLLSNQ